MLRAFIVLAMAFASVAVGCREEASSGKDRDRSTLTAAELGWIRGYSSWTFGFYDEEPDVGSDAVVACRQDVEQIGPPPSPRLEDAAGSLSAICPLVERIGSMRRAKDEVERIDDLLRPYLRDEQPLQLRSGITDRSRADVVLSDIASTAIGEPIEVRCWDEPDWSRVVGEDNVWNDVDDAEDLVGWSDDASGRIHLVLEMCNTITEAANSDMSTWARVYRIDAIDAIETLRHEVEHFLSPDASEAETECQAIRSLPAFARRFGASHADALKLTELYRTVVYPDLDAEYNAGGCPRAD